jgi:hypothetical protein
LQISDPVFPTIDAHVWGVLSNSRLDYDVRASKVLSGINCQNFPYDTLFDATGWPKKCPMFEPY